MRLLPDSERGTAGDNAVELDDCQFHQCVRLTKFDVDRTISFIPPDGEFELMKSVVFFLRSSLSNLTNLLIRYRCTTNVNLPLRIQPIVIEHGRSRVEYTIAVRTTFNSKLSATEIVLRIPTPLNTTTVDVKCATGKGKYLPEENVILWKCVLFSNILERFLVLNNTTTSRIPRLQGGAECTLTAMADLAATTNRVPWARPPIDVDFQVLMFTSSGLLVRFLKVFEKSGYNSVKWVRYLTKAAGSYQIRVR